MKSNCFKTSSLHQEYKAIKSVLALVLWMFISFSCNEIKKEEPILPENPFVKPIGSIQLVFDSLTGFATLPISALHLDKSKTFTFEAKDFIHGSFDLANDSQLVYIPKPLEIWGEDSGTLKVCQGVNCKNGFLKIRNPQVIPNPDTPIVITIQWLKGTPLPDMPELKVGDLGSTRITNFDGLQEAGAELDSVGALYTAQIRADKVSINYLPGGGLANGLGLVNDRIFYRIKRSNGQFYRGTIPILIGDTCQPRARQDVVVVPNSGGFINHSSLEANDIGCPPTISPRPTVIRRLDVRPYTGSRTINTRFGTIKDSSGAFYYKRILNVNFADTTDYFMAEGDVQKVSIARLIIKKQ